MDGKTVKVTIKNTLFSMRRSEIATRRDLSSLGFLSSIPFHIRISMEKKRAEKGTQLLFFSSSSKSLRGLVFDLVERVDDP